MKVAPTKDAKRKATTSSPVSNEKKAKSSGFDATTSEGKLLKSVAEWHSVGVTEPTRLIAASRAGYKNVDTKSIRSCFSKKFRLFLEGLIDLPTKDTIKITEKGLAQVGPVDVPSMTAEEIFNQYVLPTYTDATEARIVGALKDGRMYGMADLLEATGYKNKDSKPFRSARNNLKKRGDVEISGDEHRLADRLFPVGRPNA